MNTAALPLLARQPIVNDQGKIIGYELLFRGQPTNLPDISGERATSQVLLNAFTQLDLASAVNGKLAFINYTKALLDAPPSFIKGHLIIELLETIEFDQAFVRHIRRLAEQGYRFALDDFVPGSAGEAALPFVEYIKLDIQALPWSQVVAFCQRQDLQNKRIIAEKVETHKEMAACQALGIEYFQGYYLAMPEIVAGRQHTPSKTTTLQLMAKISDPDIDFDELHHIIASDGSLSYKVLKLVNSGYFRRVSKIESLKQAMAILGLDNLKAMAAMLLLQDLPIDNAGAQSATLSRALFVDHLCQAIRPSLAQQAFTTSILSSLALIFGKQHGDEMIASLTLADPVMQALSDYSGIIGRILKTAIAVESLTPENIDKQLLAANDLSQEDITRLYLAAVSQADEQLKSFG